MSECCEYCSLSGYRVYTHRNTVVCTMCGLEKGVPFDLRNEPNDWTRNPVMTCYSRRKRFAKLFDNTITAYAEKNDTPMLKFLEDFVLREGKFADCDEMIKTIKNAPLHDKRYGSLHVMCKLFMKGYKQPPPPKNLWRVRKRILKRFEDFEFAHKRYRGDNYFNYRWLLTKLLTELNLTDYLRFVKKLKCPIRCKHYEDMFEELQTKLLGVMV